MKTVIILFSFVLVACSEKAIHIVDQNSSLQPPPYLASEVLYQTRADEVQEIWTDNNGTTVKRFAYLPNFDSTNIDDWRAIILYGNQKVHDDFDARHTEIIYFVLSESSPLPKNFSEFDEEVNHSIFAQFNSWNASDALMFQVDMYSSHEESFHNSYRLAQVRIQEEFPDVFLY